MTRTDLTLRLEAVVARHIGAPGTVSALVPVTGGATKHTYSFYAQVGDVRLPFILQLSTASADKAATFTPRLTARQDAALMKAAIGRGVPAPRVCALLEPGDGLGDGYITARIPGEALGKKIVHDPAFEKARQALTVQFGRSLAGIHGIDPARHPQLMAFGAAAQIEGFAGIVEHYGVRSPVLAYALAWSREHAPASGPVTVVHGDFRMGNVMVDQDGLAGVLDWESAHTGDPMQDLGYLCVNTWRFGSALPVAGVGTREQLFSAYEAAGGCPVNANAVRFWEAWGSIKWAIGAMRKGLRYRDKLGPPTLEQCVIGRRMEEPLWDFFELIGQENA